MGGQNEISNMRITVSNKIFLQDVPTDFAGGIKTRLTLKNPAWIEAVKMGRWTGNLDEYLHCYEISENGLILPRGLCRKLVTLCRDRSIPCQFMDNRRTLPDVSFTFDGKLKAFQRTAVDAVLERDFGVLSSPTGSGKTIMALAIVAARKQPTLIVVHTRELLNQWIDRIGAFLGIPATEIGIIGGGKTRIGDKLTVALVQSLYKCASDVAPYVGHLIVDECHRTPSRTFSEAVSAFDSRYMLGLSATPYRRDGLDRLINWALGDVSHTVDSASLVENGHILKAEVVTRETEFETYLDASEQYSQVLSELTRDHARNLLICRDVATEALNGGGICLVLSDRKSHCQVISEILRDHYNVKAELLTGDLPKSAREDVVDRLNQGQVKVLIATSQLLSEGFDCKELSTLFMITPISFEGRLVQCMGRILRPGPGKRARVYDYSDVNVGVLAASGRARQKVYAAA